MNKVELQDVRQRQLLSLAISLSIDLEARFKLYSYRCISEKEYIKQVEILVDNYRTSYYEVTQEELNLNTVE